MSLSFFELSNSSNQRTTHIAVETGHGDMIHDARVNFLGTKLATASADRTVRIFEINLNTGYRELTAELKAHQGPIWQLSWAHPKFGNIIASCSYDRTVIVWKEIETVETLVTIRSGHASISSQRSNPDDQNVCKWERIFVYDGHESSVNCVSWAPHEFGLILACASSDSSISVLSCSEQGNRWTVNLIANAHPLGCNSVSWCPFTMPSENGDQSKIRFVTGGNDSAVKIWKEIEGEWREECSLFGHSDWVRDVAWAPITGNSSMRIASGGQDRRVIIWNNSGGNSNEWIPEPICVFDDVVWNVSWSLSADMLAVSGGENEVSLWKQKGTGWECVSCSTGKEKV